MMILNELNLFYNHVKVFEIQVCDITHMPTDIITIMPNVYSFLMSYFVISSFVASRHNASSNIADHSSF